MEKRTMQETIEVVKGNYSSVFTKDDVLRLLSEMQETGGSIELALPSLKKKIEDHFDYRDNDDLIDNDDVSFEIIHGNQIRCSGINIYTSNLVSEVMEVIEEHMNDIANANDIMRG